MLFFKKYNGIGNMPKPYMHLSLGNMGYSSSQCSIIPLGAGIDDTKVYVPIQCPTGTDFGAIHDSGINPANLRPNNFC